MTKSWIPWPGGTAADDKSPTVTLLSLLIPTSREQASPQSLLSPVCLQSKPKSWLHSGESQVAHRTHTAFWIIQLSNNLVETVHHRESLLSPKADSVTNSELWHGSTPSQTWCSSSLSSEVLLSHLHYFTFESVLVTVLQKIMQKS